MGLTETGWLFTNQPPARTVTFDDVLGKSLLHYPESLWKLVHNCLNRDTCVCNEDMRITAPPQSLGRKRHIAAQFEIFRRVPDEAQGQLTETMDVLPADQAIYLAQRRSI